VKRYLPSSTALDRPEGVFMPFSPLSFVHRAVSHSQVSFTSGFVQLLIRKDWGLDWSGHLAGQPFASLFTLLSFARLSRPLYALLSLLMTWYPSSLLFVYIYGPKGDK